MRPGPRRGSRHCRQRRRRRCRCCARRCLRRRHCRKHRRCRKRRHCPTSARRSAAAARSTATAGGAAGPGSATAAGCATAAGNAATAGSATAARRAAAAATRAAAAARGGMAAASGPRVDGAPRPACAGLARSAAHTAVTSRRRRCSRQRRHPVRAPRSNRTTAPPGPAPREGQENSPIKTPHYNAPACPPVADLGACARRAESHARCNDVNICPSCRVSTQGRSRPPREPTKYGNRPTGARSAGERSRSRVQREPDGHCFDLLAGRFENFDQITR